MKLAVTSSAVVAAIVLAALAVAAAGGATTSTAEQIRAAELTRLQGAVDGDSAAVAAILAPDFQLIDALGSPETRADYLANVSGRIDFVTLRPVSPIRVRSFGNSAVARYQAAFEVVAGPARLKHRGWNTDLFERRAGRWLLVWSQTTPTPNDPELLIEALKARS